MAISGSFEEILSKYRSLIKAAVAKYAPLLNDKAEREDMEQTALLALYRAFDTFDEKQSNVTFGLYAKICVRNACVSMLRKKRKQIRHDVIIPDRQPSAGYPEIAIGSLSDMERRVLLLFADGLSYREISEETGLKRKSVANALCRARRKLKGGILKL